MEQTTREQERGSTAARNRDEATQRGSAAARLVSMALLSTRSQQILFADACCLLLLCAPRFAIEGRLSGESSRAAASIFEANDLGKLRPRYGLMQLLP